MRLEVAMNVTKFRVAAKDGGWCVEEDDTLSAPYATKEAALEAAAGFASVALARGDGIEISIPPGAEGRWA